MLFAYASMGGAPGERVKGMLDARAEFISAPKPLPSRHDRV